MELLKTNDLRINHQEIPMWVLIRSIVNLEKETGIKVEDGQGEPFEVELKINGHEVPFVKTVNTFFTNIEEYIQEKAVERISDELKSIDECGTIYKEMMKSFERDLRTKFGLLPSSDDDC